MKQLHARIKSKNTGGNSQQLYLLEVEPWWEQESPFVFFMLFSLVSCKRNIRWLKEFSCCPDSGYVFLTWL